MIINDFTIALFIISKYHLFVIALTASGKSNFLKLLEADSPEWSIVAEPVARWTNISSNKVCICIFWCKCNTVQYSTRTTG